MAKVETKALHKSGKPVVGILTGSPSDLEVVKKAESTLHALGIPCELFVLSAHRTPELVTRYCREAETRGLEVIIACAGMAAHLAGVVAAHTFLPVIGVPLKASLDGMDALLATVQMPPGIPVATVGIDNAKNAAYLAARMLARKFPELKERLAADLAEQRTRYDDPFADTATGKSAKKPGKK
jgi:5-(carboxyamino)imidazole ribonucleotide mutase